MLVNDETLAYVLIVRRVLQWSHPERREEGHGCWSMIEHWRMLWLWEKFFNALITMNRRRTSDVGEWWSIGECVHSKRNSSMIWSPGEQKRTSDVGRWSKIAECYYGERNSSMISSRWREEGYRRMWNDQSLPNVMMGREILQWSHLDEEKIDIWCWRMIKHWGMFCWWERIFNDLVWMKRKGHRVFVNDQWLANFMIVIGIVQWSNLDVESRDIGCWSMLKHWRMCSSWEACFNDVISMKRKRTSEVGRWENIGECVDRMRNSWMISYRWRENEQRMFSNDQRFANAMMMRELFQWSDLDEEKKDIGCWSMIKHWRMWWWWEKLFNDFISMKRKQTSDVGQCSTIGECDDDELNSSMISSRRGGKVHRILGNDEALANVMMMS